MCCGRGFLYADDTFQVTFHSLLMINDGEYHSVKRKKKCELLQSVKIMVKTNEGSFQHLFY